MGDELARVLAGARERPLAVVRAAADREGTQTVHGRRVVVAIDRIGRIARLVPDERDCLPVDRHRDRPGRRRTRLELGEWVGRGRLVDAEGPHACRLELLVEPRPVCAFRQPHSPGPGAESRAVRSDPGRKLELRALLGCEQREHGVRGGRRPQLDRACALKRREGAQHVAIAPLELRRRPLVVPRRGAKRVGGLAVSRLLESGDVDFVAVDPGPSHETEESLADLGHGELVGQHGRDAQGRHRPPMAFARALEQGGQRQVARGHRLQQPLLTERPGAEPFHVRHVRMKHDAKVVPLSHGRHTASRSSARSSGPSRSAKSRSPMAGTKRS